jgi:metal-sulfur cluster biosynthetic enzyme
MRAAPAPAARAGRTAASPGALQCRLPACSLARRAAPPAAACAPRAAPHAPHAPHAPPACAAGAAPQRLASRRTLRRGACVAAAAAAAAPSAGDAESAVYAALRRIIDPDFGADIVECGFVKELRCDAATGDVSFVLELTTPVRPCAGREGAGGAAALGAGRRRGACAARVGVHARV